MASSTAAPGLVSSPNRESAILPSWGLLAKSRYKIDPESEYPANFTGHLRAILHDGTVHELTQNQMRGESLAPLADGELERKFVDKALHGGWSKPTVERARVWCTNMFNVGAVAAVTSFRR